MNTHPLQMNSYPELSLAERDRRWTAARNLMDERELDALLIVGDRDGSGPPQYNLDVYFTCERPGSVVVFPREGDPVVHVWSPNCLTDNMESVRRGDGVWIEPSQFRIGKGSGPLIATIEEKGLSKARFGVANLEPFGPLYPEGSMPWVTYEKVREAFGEASFDSVGVPLVDMTMTRSAEEIECMRKSAAVGEAMCQAALAAARPGASEAEVYAAATAAASLEGGSSYWMIMVSGPDRLNWGPPAWLYRPQPPRVLEDGDLLLLELFPLYAGYETQQQITIAIGDLHPDTERAAAAARACYERGMEMLKPGLRFGDLIDAMDEPIREAGGWSMTPNIHTLPLEAVGRAGIRGDLPEMGAYPGAELSDTRRPDLTLEPGTAFAFEPNCVFGRRRVNIGGTVIMSEEGCEELNQLANHLRRAG